MTELELHQSALPSRSEFQHIQQMSEVLASSDLVPASYRRKPANVILATLAGRPFGWDPTMSMRSFHIIEGVPSMKPEIMLALIRKAGHSVNGEASATSSTVTGKRADTGDEMSFTFTMDDAHQAGLDGKKVWKQYPASMLWARALSQLARMLFPDVVLGAGYTPEEFGADDGDVVDVAEVDGVTLTWSQAEVKRRLVGIVGAPFAPELWDLRPASMLDGGDAVAGVVDGKPWFHADQVQAWLDELESLGVEDPNGRTDDIEEAEIVEEPTLLGEASDG